MPSILIADDEASVRQSLRKVLEDAGHKVLEAGNGKEAMVQIRRTTIDLVIIDLIMPEQEGLETILALRKNHPGMKIIAISGSFGELPQGGLLRIAELLGAKASMEKPLTANVVLETVNRVLGSQ